MSDPRLTRANGRVAHIDLKGAVAADRFVEPQAKQVQIAKTRLCRAPVGPVERELLCGDVFQVLEWPADDPNGWAFGYAEKDGYCGYVHASFLHDVMEPTHLVQVRETYRQESADLKSGDRKHPLFFGSQVRVEGREGAWSRIALKLGGKVSDRVFHYFVPSCHLAPVGGRWSDPVDVARLFLGTPYVWGGNAGNGIDCSGLVQAALLACGVPCPGDSDLQERMPGEAVALADLAPGDLIFWKGHVAMVSGENRVIHANAHHMAVVEEPMDVAIERIAASETGPVTSCLRVTPPRG